MTQNDPSFQIYTFNVGGGDNFLIRFHDGTYGVIDFYYEGDICPDKEPPSLTFLRNCKENGEKIEIKFFHISHFHFDHIKGLNQWLEWIIGENIEVGKFWLPGSDAPQIIFRLFNQILTNPEFKFPKSESKWLNRYNQLKRQNEGPFDLLEKVININSQRIVYLDDIKPLHIPNKKEEISLIAYCLAPLSYRAKNYSKRSSAEILFSLLHPKEDYQKQDGNDISAIVKLVYGPFQLLFGGDARNDSIKESIYSVTTEKRGGFQFDFKSDFVKSFHHGSRHSSDPDIWNAIILSGQNLYVAFSAGDNIKNNHPSPDTLEHIRQVSGQNTTTKFFYATNRHFLLKRGESDIDEAVPLTVTLSTRKKKFASRIKEKRYAVSTPLSLYQGRSKFSEIDFSHDEEGEFLGYRFDFYTDSKNVEVKRLVWVPNQ